jgi:hypothetical protein
MVARGHAFRHKNDIMQFDNDEQRERESSHNDEDEPSIREYMYNNFLNNLRTCVSLPCFTRLLF